MPNFFTLKDGNLFDSDVFYPTLANQDYIASTTGNMLLSSNLLSIPYFNLTNTISALAVNVFSRNENPVGTLSLVIEGRSFNSNTYYSPNHTIVAVGNVYQNTFTPFRPDGWSVLFDTTAHVVVPRINFSNQPFTIEGWFNPILPVGAGTNLFGQNNGAGLNPKITFYSPVGTGQLAVTFNSGTTSTTLSTVSTALTVPASSVIPVNQWTHLAVVREGTGTNQCKIYANGFVVASGTFAGNLSAITQSFNIGHVGETYGTKFNGYISNFRILTGSALYTDNFTPSNSPLTNISNTALLALQSNSISKDNSNNDSYLTTVGTPRIRAVTPFTPTVPYSKNLHGGSISLRGGGFTRLNTLSTPNFSTTNFTVEAWVYLRSNSSSYSPIASIGNGSSNNSNYSWVFVIQPTSTLTIATYNGNGGVGITSTRVLSLNSWYHVAAVRNGASLSIYINGVLAGTNNAAYATINYDSSMIYSIGSDFTASLAGYSFDGYISNLRVVYGEVLYTTNFTPSTSPLTNITNTNLLLNTDNVESSILSSSFTDTYAISSFTPYDTSIREDLNVNSPQNWQILKLSQPLSANLNYTIGLSTSNSDQLSLLGDTAPIDEALINKPSFSGNVTTSLFAPTNYKSSFLITEGTFITYPANGSFNFDGDFTWELWFNNTVFTADNGVGRRIISFGANAANNLQLILGTSTQNTNVVSLFTDSAVVNGTIPVSDGNWYHIAVSKVGNVLKLFVNGVQSGLTYTTFTVYNAGVTTPLSIGTYNNSSTTGRLSGAYISDLRMVKGVGLYTSNFTVPSGGPLQLVNNAENIVLLKSRGFNFNKYLINTNNNVVDLSGSITKTGTTLSAGSPYGAGVDGSIEFNGTTNYLSRAGNTVCNFGVCDFTVESWILLKAMPTSDVFPSNMGLIQSGTPSTVDGCSFIIGSTRLSVRTNNDTIYYSTTHGLTSNKWHHIAYVRSGDTIYFYADGALKGTAAFTGPVQGGSNTYIGTETAQGAYFNGFISNLRVIIGTGLYTTPSFTPSLQPFNTIFKIGTYTSLLYKAPYSTQYLYNFDGNFDLHIGGALSGLNTEYRTVTADNVTVNNLYIHNNGILTFPLTSSKTLNIVGSNGIRITSDGTLNIGTSSVKIPSNITHTIVLSNTEINILNGGNLNVYGSDKLPYTYLIQDATSSTRAFTTTDSVSTTWLSGDAILFTPNTINKSSYDIAILSSFNSNNNFTITGTNTHIHNSISSLPYVPTVSNLTRNVTIRSLVSSVRCYIRTQDASKVNINNTKILDTDNFYVNNIFGGTTLSGNVYENTTNTLYYKKYAAYCDVNVVANSYITLPADALIIETGRFTLEFWFNPQSFTGDTTISVMGTKRWKQGRNSGWELTYYRSGYFVFDYSTGVFDSYSTIRTNNFSKVVPTEKNWMHIAFVRDAGNVMRFYVNGKSVGFVNNPVLSQSFNLHYQSVTISKIGVIWADDVYTQYGGFYINSLRLNQGQALYTSEFTPPYLPVTTTSQGSIASNVRFLFNVLSLTKPFVDTSPVRNAITKNSTMAVYVDPTGADLNSNINIQKNIFYRNIGNGLDVSFLSGVNINLSDNMILRSNIGIRNFNVNCPLTLRNNYIVGSTSYGTYVYNVVGSNIGSTINYNGLTQGAYFGGINTGTITLTSVYNAGDGIYINSVEASLENLKFSNILTDSNFGNGLQIFGNGSDYLNPITLNIDNYYGYRNFGSALTASNIVGTLSNIYIANNSNGALNTFIGNGRTIISNLTSIDNNYYSFDRSNNVMYRNGSVSNVIANPFDDSGAGSSYFSTSNGAYVINRVNLGTSDFTIESWVYCLGYNTVNTLFTFGTYNIANPGFGIILRIRNGDGFYINNASVGDWSGGPTYANVPLNTWHHVALVRRGLNLNVYVNGVSRLSSTTATIYNLGTQDVWIGNSKHQQTEPFNGYMSNFRISNSAVYTSNFNLSAPISPRRQLNWLPSTQYLFRGNINNIRSSNSVINNFDMILSGRNYNETIINNFIADENNNGILLNSTRFEHFVLQNSNLYNSLYPLSTLATSNILEGSYNYHNNLFQESTLSASLLNNYQSDTYTETAFSFMKHNRTTENHFRISKAGKISYDRTVVNAPNKVSERLEPYSSSVKLRSVKLIPINKGESYNISVTIKKSLNYTGATPRLILKHNGSLGYNRDYVLATSVLGNNVWETMTGSLPSRSLDNGMVEVYVDCSGNLGSGYINIDSWKLI